MIHSVNIRIKHLYQMHGYTPEDGKDWNKIIQNSQSTCLCTQNKHCVKV